jgi:hypothetical protein
MTPRIRGRARGVEVAMIAPTLLAQLDELA